MTTVLLALPGSGRMARNLARGCGGTVGELTVHRFPDGESCVRLVSDVTRRPTVLVASLARPDAKLAALLFAARLCRDRGASKVGLVAPYLPYMRQDVSFRPGEAVTSRYFADLLSNAFDWLVTVEPHLHRIASLSAIFSVPAEAISAAPAIAPWILANVSAPLLVGPDVESEPWVRAIAQAVDAPHVVATKVRRGDEDVSVSLPDLSTFVGREPVVVDDIVSSGQTMVETVRGLCEAGQRPPTCIAVHALFGDGVVGRLRDAGAARVVSCNTVPHATNAIDVTPLLTQGVERMLAGARP